MQALKAQWAAEDEAAHQGEVEARLGQQRLNAEVKEFNRWAQSPLLQHRAGPCGQLHSGVSIMFGDCLLRVECGRRPPGPAAPECRGPITAKILVGRAAPVCSACNNEACLAIKKSGRPIRLAAWDVHGRGADCRDALSRAHIPPCRAPPMLVGLQQCW